MGRWKLISTLINLQKCVKKREEIIANFAVIIILQSQTRKDLEAFKAGYRNVQSANWFIGCLIGLLGEVIYFVLATVVIFFMALLGGVFTY